MITKVQLNSFDSKEIEIFPYTLQQKDNTYYLNCKVKTLNGYGYLNIDIRTIFTFNSKVVDEVFIIRPLTKPTPIPEKVNCLVIYIDTLDRVSNIDLIEYDKFN